MAILVMALLIWNYYGDKGMFSNVKDAADTLWSYAPNVSIGLTTLNATMITLPGDQASQISGLQATLVKMLDSSEQDCFANFGPLDNLGEGVSIGSSAGAKGESEVTTHISFYLDSNTQETVFIVGTSGSQIYKNFRLKMTPCVVAGPYDVAENFFQHFNKNAGNLKEPYYNLVMGGDISYQKRKIGYSEETGGVFSAYSGNAIRVVGFPPNMVNDENDNFENGGMIFKGKGNEICFFPTNKASNSDIDGMDNNYVSDETNEESLIYKWKNGKVKKCY